MCTGVLKYNKISTGYRKQDYCCLFDFIPDVTTGTLVDISVTLSDVILSQPFMGRDGRGIDDRSTPEECRFRKRYVPSTSTTCHRSIVYQ